MYVDLSIYECRYLRNAKEGVRSSRTGFMGRCELAYMGHLQEQCVLLYYWPFLQLLKGKTVLSKNSLLFPHGNVIVFLVRGESHMLWVLGSDLEEYREGSSLLFISITKKEVNIFFLVSLGEFIPS